MSKVLLIYPYFQPRRDRSIFRFPPLGAGYIAAALKRAGHGVEVLDCTFSDRDDALQKARGAGAEVVGIYSMMTMREESLLFARYLRPACKLLIAGGPLPSCDPLPFLDHFDIVVRGEGERTIVELLQAYEQGTDFGAIPGIVFRRQSHSSRGQAVFTEARAFENDLDGIPFPDRSDLPNRDYIEYGKRRRGCPITTIITTRGCPFNCEFCSNVVFGVSYRERSAANVVDEVEQALELGYNHVHFADDVFTLRKERVSLICEEIKRRRLKLKWECLGRVDSIDRELASAMRGAGCERIFFGIESGDDSILKRMNKKITAEKARRAVEACAAVGLKVGAFFILFYPGETDDTVLATLRFATSLPLDYLSFTMPYPLPGTALYERVKSKITREWKQPDSLFFDHVRIFNADFSETKMRFGILKGKVQFELKKRLGKPGAFVARLIEKPTDKLLRLMK